MAEEKQPAGIVEGATTGDVEDEIQDTAKSAEDRKAAAALSKLDARDDELGPSKDVDQEGLSRAMNKLEVSKKTEETRDLKKVKVDAADVALLVEELELSKPKATDLLKQYDGDAIKAMKAFIGLDVE